MRATKFASEIYRPLSCLLTSSLKMRGGHLRSTFISSKTVILTGNLCSTDNFSNKNGFEIENSQMEKNIFLVSCSKTFEY